MLVLTPVVASIFLLTVMLGRFAGLPVRAQIKGAKWSRSWARARRATLPPNSKLAPWVTILITAMTGTLLGFAVYILVPPRAYHPRIVLATFLILIILSCVLSVMSFGAIYTQFIYRDKTDPIFLWLITALIYFFVLMGAFFTFGQGSTVPPADGQEPRAIGLAMTVTCFAVVVSTFWLERFKPRGLHQWTLHAAGACSARKSLTKAYKKDNDKIKRLTRQLEEEEPSLPVTGDSTRPSPDCAHPLAR